MAQFSFSIQDPNSNTVTPPILLTDQFGPSVRLLDGGVPELTVPTKYDTKYSGSDWQGNSVSASVGSVSVPVDELVEHKPVEVEGEKVSVLICRGASELRRQMDTRVTAKETHLVAKDAVANNTSYATNVDTPPTSTTTNATVQGPLSTTAEFRGALLDPFEPTTPLRVNSGSVELLQAGFTSEAENGSIVGSTSGTTDSGFSNSTAAFFDSAGGSVSTTLSSNYRIPRGSVKVAARVGFPSGGVDGPDLHFTIDGYRVSDTFRPAPTDFKWISAIAPLELAAGDHSVGIRTTSSASGSNPLGIDVLTIVDDRYTWTFDNTTATSGDGSSVLSGPELYPDAEDVVFEDATPADAVPGGRVEATLNDTSNNQAVALSNDRGSSYSSSANTDTYEVDFTDRGAFLRTKITLSRYGSGANSTPSTGFNGQTITDLTLKADLEDMPMVVDERLRGQVGSILDRLATTERGNFRWTVTTGPTVEWTQPDQRIETRDPAVIADSIEVSRASGATTNKITVVGGHQQVTDELITATVGSAVDLDHDNVRPESERVYDPRSGAEDTFAQYDPGVDYTLDADAGTLTALSGGAISDGDVVAVDYAFQPSATEATSGVTNPESETYRVARLSTDRACVGAARRILTATSAPRNEARVAVPGADIDYSVVASADWSAIPTETELWELTSVEAHPSRTTITWESAEDVGEVLSALRGDISALGDQA